MRRAASRPFRRGMVMSRTTTSGLVSSACSPPRSRRRLRPPPRTPSRLQDAHQALPHDRVVVGQEHPDPRHQPRAVPRVPAGLRSRRRARSRLRRNAKRPANRWTRSRIPRRPKPRSSSVDRRNAAASNPAPRSSIFRESRSPTRRRSPAPSAPGRAWRRWSGPPGRRGRRGSRRRGPSRSSIPSPLARPRAPVRCWKVRASHRRVGSEAELVEHLRAQEMRDLPHLLQRALRDLRAARASRGDSALPSRAADAPGARAAS